LVRRILHVETSLINGKPIVFLTHPNEFIDEESETDKIKRRGNNYMSYILGDIIRHRLKVKNLGEKAIPIFNHEISFFNKKGYKFLTCKEFYNKIQKINAG
jgi:hypothetical protein